MRKLETYMGLLTRLCARFNYVDWVCMVTFLYLSLDVRLQYFYYVQLTGKGFPQSDDSKWYLSYARSLMEHKTIGLHMNDILYAGYNVLLTALLALVKSPVNVIFIQAVIAGAAVLLVYQIAKMLFNRITAVIASFMYCYHAWGITLWSMYILSDSFFISLLLLCVYLLLLAVRTNNSAYKIAFAISAFYLLIFRPTGVLCLLFFLIYIVMISDRNKWMRLIAKHRLAIGTGLVVLLAGGAYAMAGDRLAPFIQSLQLNAKMVLYNIYAFGWIYDKPSAHDHFFRPDYKITLFNSLVVSFIVNNIGDISIIYAKRVIAFIGRWVWEIDLGSVGGIKRFAWNALPTVLFIIGTAAAIVNRMFKKAAIVWLIVLSVFLYCILLFIDGMYRYKAPGIPFIAIVAAYGLERSGRFAVYAARRCLQAVIAGRGKRQTGVDA